MDEPVSHGGHSHERVFDLALYSTLDFRGAFFFLGASGTYSSSSEESSVRSDSQSDSIDESEWGSEIGGGGSTTARGGQAKCCSGS